MLSQHRNLIPIPQTNIGGHVLLWIWAWKKPLDTSLDNQTVRFPESFPCDRWSFCHVVDKGMRFKAFGCMKYCKSSDAIQHQQISQVSIQGTAIKHVQFILWLVSEGTISPQFVSSYHSYWIPTLWSLVLQFFQPLPWSKNTPQVKRMELKNAKKTQGISNFSKGAVWMFIHFHIKS